MSNISIVNHILSEYTQSSEEGETIRISFNTYNMVFELIYQNKEYNLVKIQELYYDLDNMIKYCHIVKDYLKELKGFRTIEKLFDELKDFKI